MITARGSLLQTPLQRAEAAIREVEVTSPGSMMIDLVRAFDRIQATEEQRAFVGAMAMRLALFECGVTKPRV